MIINVVVAGLLLVSGAGGDDPGPGVRAETSQHGNTAEIKLTNSQIIVSGNGGGGKSDGYRLKRPCWYEPAQNAADMLDFQRKAHPSEAWHPDEQKRRNETLKRFQEKVGEEGRWWTVAHDASDPKGVACQLAMEPYVFVPPGTTPPNGITIQDLVDIARAALTVPEPKIRLSPDAQSYVNLPTWVWLDGTGDTTRSVTATLPGVMSATVTATLRNIDIDPGTTGERAEVKDKDACGPTGRPYVKGAKDFTCGVRYLRASVDQPRDVYELTVTSSWDVAVQDNVVPFAYDPIQMSATRDVEVGEVQSTVRGNN
ncbi:hypothetical protein [Streptosporangium sp. NPDC000396]|uniref:hypothetical protein n=1 Tax=Streptosporangium sp. NPDC000396 TaxID=3366185 RepID=UPI003675FFD1